MNLIRNIYSWLNPIYGSELYEYLKGNDCNGVYTGPNHFATIGIMAIAISLFIVLLYYYIINHPRLNRLWHWSIFLLVTGIINLLVGFGYIYTKLYSGQIHACYTHSQTQVAPDGSIYGVDGTEILTNLSCWQFGIANAIIAMFIYIILSAILKWGSNNCKNSPF